MSVQMNLTLLDTPIPGCYGGKRGADPVFRPHTPMPTTPRTGRQASLHFRVLHLLEQRPDLTQWQLAEAPGISVGQTNFLLKAMLHKGQVKLANCQRGDQILQNALLCSPQKAA